jgi:hypothetical protein
VSARSTARRPVLAWASAIVVLLAVNTLTLAGAGYSPWWHALGAGVGNAVEMALVSFVAWRTALRPWLPIGASPRSRLWLNHVAAAAIVSVAAVAINFAGRHLPHEAVQRHPQGAGPGAGFLLWWFLFLYAAAAGVTHALATRALLRARELEVVRAELRALRSQLDPHFLFNALHSISVLVRNDPRRAEEAVERFGDLLRYVLRAGRPEPVPAADSRAAPLDREVPLEEELAFVHDYLEVERIRFGERLRVREDIDATAAGTLVPPLILQPLVENAVKYAVSSRRAGATIHVVARRAEDPQLGGVLRLGVLDDGLRALPDGDDIRTPARGLPIAGERVGLDGLRRRLAASHGDAYRMEVTTTEGEGFGVWIVLPWRIASLPPLRAPRKMHRHAMEDAHA